VKFKKALVVVLVLVALFLSWKYVWGFEARLLRDAKALRTVRQVRDFSKKYNLALSEEYPMRGSYSAMYLSEWKTGSMNILSRKIVFILQTGGGEDVYFGRRISLWFVGPKPHHFGSAEIFLHNSALMKGIK
jgi:hypothetical protein